MKKVSHQNILDKTQNMICANCKSCFRPRNTPYLRCCDENVCSLSCALARLEYIRSFDPELNAPYYWTDNKPFEYQVNKARISRSFSSLSLATIVEEETENKPKDLNTFVFAMILLPILYIIHNTL